MNFNCPICGTPMVHSRLRGYHCHFERHNEQWREVTNTAALLMAARKLDEETAIRYAREAVLGKQVSS